MSEETDATEGHVHDENCGHLPAPEADYPSGLRWWHWVIAIIVTCALGAGIEYFG